MRMKKNVFKGKKISYIYLRGFNPTCDNIIKLVDIIPHEYLLGVFIALDTKNEFIKALSEDHMKYDVLFPPDNSITSKTLMIASKGNFISVLPQILMCEPRCVTFYGLCSGYDMRTNINKQPFLDLNFIDSIGNCITDVSISVVIDEFYVEISLNSKVYDAKALLRQIETQILY